MSNNQIAHITTAFVAWCVAGILLCLAAIAILASTSACMAHGPQLAEGWSAQIQPPMARAPRLPRTYRLTPLPDVSPPQRPVPMPDANDRAAVDALIWLDMAREAARRDMAIRHKLGIVLPDEL